MRFNEFLVEKLEELRFILVAEHGRELLKSERKVALLEEELANLRKLSVSSADIDLTGQNHDRSSLGREIYSVKTSPALDSSTASLETGKLDSEPADTAGAENGANRANTDSKVPQNRWLRALVSTGIKKSSIRGSNVSWGGLPLSPQASPRPSARSSMEGPSRRSTQSNHQPEEPDLRRVSSKSAATCREQRHSNRSTYSLVKRSESVKSQKKTIIKEARKTARARAQLVRSATKSLRQAPEHFDTVAFKCGTHVDIAVDDIASRHDPMHALNDMGIDVTHWNNHYHSEHSAGEKPEAHGGRRYRPTTFGDADDICNRFRNQNSANDPPPLFSAASFEEPTTRPRYMVPMAASQSHPSSVPSHTAAHSLTTSASGSLVVLPPGALNNLHDLHHPRYHELHQPRCDCGNTFTADAKFCRKCGNQRPQDQVCSCGAVFQFDSNFCNRCGRRRPCSSGSGCSDIHCCHESKEREEKYTPERGQRCESKDLSATPAISVKTSPVENVSEVRPEAVTSCDRGRRPQAMPSPRQRREQQQQPQLQREHRSQESVTIPGSMAPSAQDGVSNLSQDMWSQFAQDQDCVMGDEMQNTFKVETKMPSALVNGQGASHGADASDDEHVERPGNPMVKELSQVQVVHQASENAGRCVKALRFGSEMVETGEFEMTGQPSMESEGEDIHTTREGRKKSIESADTASDSTDSASIVMLAAHHHGSVDSMLDGDSEDGEAFPLLGVWEQQMWRKSMRVKRDQAGDAEEDDQEYENIVIVKHAVEDDTDFIASRFECWRKIMIQPSSKKHLIWEALGLLFIFFDVVMVPMDVFDPPDTQVVLAMSWVVRFFWTLDIVHSFLTGYLQESGTLEMRPSFVARRYLRTWFTLDVLCVGFDWATHVARTVGNYGTMLRSMRILRAVRLLRLVKAAEIERFISEHIRSDQVILTGFIMKMIVSLLVVAHLIACIWYAVGNRKGRREVGWVRSQDLLDTEVTDRYTWSLHWALGQFTGENVYEPKHMTMDERAFAVFALLVTFLISSMFVSTITTSVTKLQLSTSKQTSQMAALRRYLCDQQISTSLAVRVQRNAQHLVTERKRNMPEQSVELLGMISESLRAEVHFEVYWRTVRHHPLFDCYCEVNLAGVRKVCHTAISVWSATRGDIVFNDLETPANPRMFFCQSGALQYRRVDEKPDILRDGKFAAEAVLWTHWMHVGTLRGMTNTTMLVLEAEKFQKIVSPFPTNHAFLYAEKYVHELNMIPEEHLSDIDTVPLDHVLRAVFPERFFTSTEFQPNYRTESSAESSRNVSQSWAVITPDSP